MFTTSHPGRVARLRPETQVLSRGITCATFIVLLLLPRAALAHLDPAEQIAVLTAQIERSPGDVALLLKRGDLHHSVREDRKARADYRRARAIDPASGSIDFHLGTLHQAEGRFRRARADFDRYIARRPDNPAGFRMRARCFRVLGRPLKAAEDLRRAIAAFHPPLAADPDDYLDWARAFEAAGPGHFSEAIAALEEGMRALGPIVSLQMPAIDLDLRAGRFEEALLKVDALEAVSERRGTWSARREEILRLAEHDAGARAAFTAARHDGDP